MKKRNFACLALLAPVLTIAACTPATPSLTLSANWYKTVGSTNIAQTNESLSYKVSFEGSESNNFLSYGEGSYKTTLTYANIDGAPGYYFATELSIPVSFTIGEQTQSFTDTVKSEAWFLDVAHSLQPVKSIKTVLSHTPGQEPTTMEGAYTTYEYTYTTTYDANLANASIELAYKQPEEVSNTYSVALSGQGTYLDNEEILFALRGVNMASGITFRSINPAKRAVETVATTQSPTRSDETMTFSVNGTSQERVVPAYTFSLGYQTGINVGNPQTYTYAAVNAEDNSYRCVLLRMEVPVLHSLGTLRYTLETATFGD